ncbi:MAG: amidohydrolase [Candidatus Bathyarchaeota archaeon]|nr:MAG: amidohydrolase [Candidatus Bathyarchaeota archaeon]
MFDADLVLVNGNLITLNPKQPRAQAVAVRDGKFAAIGSNTQILSYAGKDTERIDLGGKTVVPGLTDGHVHGASLGRSLTQIDVRGVKSIDEILQKVQQWAKKTRKGKWIIGRGWDQDKLAEHRCPSRFDLDDAAPTNPVLLVRVCGHLGVVNSEALRLAKITEKTTPPRRGIIGRDAKTGRLNGIMQENALDLIFDAIPEASQETLMNNCLRACQKMVAEGITTAHWLISSPREVKALQQLHQQNMLPLRIYMLYPILYLDHIVELGFTTGFGDDKLKVGSVKILVDGSLGARTAALKQPYSDASDTKGMLLHSQSQLKAFVEHAHNANLQLAIHIIGDKAVELVLQILEQVLRTSNKKKHRHRLEHVSVLNPKLVKKMKAIGTIASVQPHFVVADVWITDRRGKNRARWTYAFQSLLRAGIVTIGGSDAPVEPVSPILGLYAAVARNTVPEERLTIDEALRLYTINAAFSSFEEDVKGSIESGKFADLTVLSHDPHAIAPEKIREIKVAMTIVDGKIVYRRR